MNAWHDRAHELARLLDQRFVNRRDIWGLYPPGGGSVTAPAMQMRGKLKLTLNDLHAHVSGEETLGAHSTSPDDLCKWIAWDIDAHNDAADPEANWRTTLELVNVVVGLGLEPVVEHSNGRGGFHIWVLFSQALPSSLAYRVGKWVKRQAGAPDVESFPKQASVRATPGGCGNYLRMPGRHHKRPWWSQFWAFDNERWLEGADAVAYLLAVPVNDPEILNDLLHLLPPVRPPDPTPTITITPGVDPVCVRDLIANSIRKTGQRNLALLSLVRYWKAAGIGKDEAIRRGAAWVGRIPKSLTTSDLTADAIRVNVASVVTSVYAGTYSFACWYMLSLGTAEQPVACNLGSCLFVKREIPTDQPDKDPVIPVDPDSFINMEVPVDSCSF